mmetsp:Transcript_7138/g.10445  ORF Transcript_7138/g.10445 Transcript_7138/m.10445 type:complete len:214 (+) Transcript_7138:195-836(+)
MRTQKNETKTCNSRSPIIVTGTIAVIIAPFHCTWNRKFFNVWAKVRRNAACHVWISAKEESNEIFEVKPFRRNGSLKSVVRNVNGDKVPRVRPDTRKLTNKLVIVHIDIFQLCSQPQLRRHRSRQLVRAEYKRFQLRKRSVLCGDSALEDIITPRNNGQVLCQPELGRKCSRQFICSQEHLLHERKLTQRDGYRTNEFVSSKVQTSEARECPE